MSIGFAYVWFYKGNFEEITIKMGEKNVAVLCTRDHSVEYNLQVDVKYGLT